MKYLLLVEDDALSRMVVEDVIRDEVLGAELVCVDSGELALELAAKLQPSLILMDIMLPGIDGMETTRQLKADPATRDIPVWALTALSLETDGLEAIEAGCMTYIRKPVNGGQLRQQLREFLGELGLTPNEYQETTEER